MSAERRGPERSNGENDWHFNPHLASIDRQLRREIREEAEEVEALIANAELRARHFADVARDAANRGDLVAVNTGRRAFHGRVVYAAGDFITIRTESFEVDINLDAVGYLRKVEAGRQGGAAVGDGAGTFEMRLVERRSPLDRVEIGYRVLDETLIGRISVVGQDHVVVLDDQRCEWTVPTKAIAYVIRRERVR